MSCCLLQESSFAQTASDTPTVKPTDADLAAVKDVNLEKLLLSCLKSFDWKGEITYDEMWDEYILPVLNENNISAKWQRYMYSRFPALVIKFYLKKHDKDALALSAINWMMQQSKDQYEWLQKQITVTLKDAHLTDVIKSES